MTGKGKGVWASRRGLLRQGKCIGELIEKGYLLGLSLCRLTQHLSISGDKGCPLAGMRQGLLHEGSLCPALSRWKEGREHFLCLFLLSCARLNIILMPKRHILGWHILIPFMCLVELGCGRDGSFTAFYS